ncbi:MAG: hypothetical protein ACOZCO_14400 [Bacteroidota bacterium]
MITELDTHNPDHITWKYEQLLFSVLGGIRLEGLDRLRVTVKIEFKQTAIRHNLDLYNDSQLEKLIRKCAERFEVGTHYLSKAISELVNRLENYRMEEIKKKSDKPENKKTLTEHQVKEAREFLKQENLLQLTGELIGKSGMIGEETNRLLMYLIFTSRKREYPLHIISLAASGTGKSYLQEKVSELIPEEDKIEITVLSENAFYYFGQRELKHKLLLIEDLDGAENVLYPLRELQSKKKINKTVAHKDSKGNTKTVHLTVEGPVSVGGCTTKESIYEDNANRSFLIYLDESKEQDERIMQRQRALSAGNINHEEEKNIKELLKNAQRILQPVSIRNPYAEFLEIPVEVFKPRRTNAHYLQFIEAITFYKQYQREQKADENTGEIFIETTLQDIEEANGLMKEILLRKSDELNTACRRYFEFLKAWMKSEKKTQFTNKEIRHALRVNHSNQKRYMLMLIENNLIKKVQLKHKSYAYEVVSYEEYEKLQGNISNVLDGILEKLKKNAPTSPVVHGSGKVHSRNELKKAAPAKEKTGKVQKFAQKEEQQENLSEVK